MKTMSLTYMGVAGVIAGTLISSMEAQEKKEHRVIRIERHDGDDPEIRVFRPGTKVERRIVRKRVGGAARPDGAWLGIHIGNVTEVTAAQLGLKPGTGLVVEHVVADSPADVAGLKRFDILTAIDDQILVNPEQLQVLVSGNDPGETVEIELLRRGKKMTIEATLKKREGGKMKFQSGEVLGRKMLKLDGNHDETIIHEWVGDSDEAEGALGSLIWQGKVRDDVKPFHSRTIQLGNAITILKDDSGTYHLKETDGQRHLRFENGEGEVIFDGVFEGDSTKELPAEVIQKLNAIRVPDDVDVTKLHRIFESRKKGPFDHTNDRIELDVDFDDAADPIDSPDRSL